MTPSNWEVLAVLVGIAIQTITTVGVFLRMGKAVGRAEKTLEILEGELAKIRPRLHAIESISTALDKLLPIELESLQHRLDRLERNQDARLEREQTREQTQRRER